MMLHNQRDADIYLSIYIYNQRDVDIYLSIYIYILSHYNVDPYIPSFNFLFLLTFYYEVVCNSIVIVIFLKEKIFITSSIKYCDCDDNNVRV